MLDVGSGVAVAGCEPAVPLVRMLRDQTFHPRATSEHSDHDRRPRRPRALGDILGFPRGVELAVERHLLAAQQRTNDLQRFLEAPDTPFPGIAERHVLRLEVAGAEPHDEAPLAQLVYRVRHPRKQRGVAVPGVHHQGSDFHPARLAGQRRGSGHALPRAVRAADQFRWRARFERLELPRGRVAEMVDQPHRVEPDLLGPAGECHDVRTVRSVPAHRVGFMRQTESDLHLVGLLGWSWANGGTGPR